MNLQPKFSSSTLPELYPVDARTEFVDEELAANPRYRMSVFRSTILPDNRLIEVYLPPQYAEEGERHFPVMYLHDGQNLFDGHRSYIPGRTWCAHTTADRLTLEGEIEPVILVGVANAGTRRMDEYTPTRDEQLGGGDGKRYGQMLIEELKPMIDRLYRTLPQPGCTGLGGSSLGGLISLCLGWEHPEIFGRLAVLSPSLWWDRGSILQTIARHTPKPKLKIWLDMGTEEGATHMRDTDALERILEGQGWRRDVDLKYVKAVGATHDEQAWAARFGDVLRFLFPAH